MEENRVNFTISPRLTTVKSLLSLYSRMRMCVANSAYAAEWLNER